MKKVETDTLRKLCDAISDGSSVDWDAEFSTAPRLGTTLRHLRALEAVGRAHRTIAEQLSGPPDPPPGAARRAGDAPAVFWGPLRLCERVGEGGFGEVYRAIDTRLQREVALKLRRFGFTDSDAGARHFLEEARSLARVRHPNVLSIHGADVHDLRVGFWTDFIHGKTLAARLQEEGPVGAGEAALVGLSLCGALAAVHAAGVIHGDVKAANVMREQGGRIVLMDFGASHWRNHPDAPDAASRPAFGTPLVLAPEIIRGESARPESDLYSLGVLLFQLVAGRYPVEASGWAELQALHERGSRALLRDVRPDLSADFARVVDRALAPDPEERFRSAGEMERALFASLPSGDVPRDRVHTPRTLMNEIGALPEELLRRIGCEAARSLEQIHAEGRALGSFDLDAMLLLENGRLKLVRPPGGSLQPWDEGERIALQRADLQRLGELLRQAGTPPDSWRSSSGAAGREGAGAPTAAGSSEQPREAFSPFFGSLLQRLAAADAGESFEASEQVPSASPITAADLATILTEGESGAWWRERVRMTRRAPGPPQRRLRTSRETALHGRERDLDWIRAAYARARGGDGQVALIEGEAGIGKTRLVDELACAVERDGEEVNFLFGSYPPGGAATELGAFIEAYRDHFGELGMEQALEEALAAAPRLIEPFSALLRGGTARGSDALTKDSLQSAFVLVTRALAAGRPTIVLIDDLHFAPEEGRNLFTALARSVPGHRILLIGTARPELPETWTAAILRSERAARLSLNRLDDSAVHDMLAEALGSGRAAEDLAPLLAKRCEGNPLFLLEHVRALEESDLVSRDAAGGWTTEGADRILPMPDSIQQLIRARLAGLEEEDRHLLEIACCWGTEFDPALVAEAAGTAVLAALRRFGLMEKRHGLIRAAGRHYVFDHHQVQETLHESLFEQLREHHHSALAAALEARERALERDPRSLDGAIVASLAEHYLRGGRGRDAARYLLPALDHLERTYQNAAAADLAIRALESPGLLTGVERISVLARLAARLEYLGRRAQENAVLEELLAVSDAHGDAHARARARRMLGALRLREARYDEARAVLEEVLEIARACGDPREESNATAYLGLISNETGRLEEAEAFFHQSLDLARRSGYTLQEIKVTGNLGVVAYGQGRLADAQATFERHLALSREGGYRLGEAIAMGNLGVILAELGKLDEAREHYERQLTLAREVGFRQSEAIATGNLGDLDFRLGRCAAALNRHERLLRLAAEIGFREGEAGAMQGIARILAALGRYDEARAWAERRRILGRDIQSPKIEGEALLLLGDLAFEQHEPMERDAGGAADAAGTADAAGLAEAERLCCEALALWNEKGYRRGAAQALLRLGRICRATSRIGEAQERLSAGLALAREIVIPTIIVAASIELAFLPGGDAGAALDAIAAHEEKITHTERLRARCRLFQRTGDAVHLDEARRLLAVLRSEAPDPDREPMMERVPLYREISLRK